MRPSCWWARRKPSAWRRRRCRALRPTTARTWCGATRGPGRRRSARWKRRQTRRRGAGRRCAQPCPCRIGRSGRMAAGEGIFVAQQWLHGATSAEGLRALAWSSPPPLVLTPCPTPTLPPPLRPRWRMPNWGACATASRRRRRGGGCWSARRSCCVVRDGVPRGGMPDVAGPGWADERDSAQLPSALPSRHACDRLPTTPPHPACRPAAPGPESGVGPAAGLHCHAGSRRRARPQVRRCAAGAQ